MNSPFLDIKENKKSGHYHFKKKYSMDVQCCYNFFLNCQEINFSRQARDAKTLSDCTHAMQLVQ